MKHGYPIEDWNKAKEEMRQILIEKAKARETITYSDLLSKIQTIKLHRGLRPFTDMLGEISREEDAAGRGMLTVLVVYKNHGKLPGDPFFTLADELGRNTSNRRKFFEGELKRVYDCWASH
jgi:hypothetical protein